MKKSATFFSVFFIVFSLFSQENPIANPKAIVKLDEATLKNELKLKIDKITLEAQNLIKTSELGKKKKNEDLNVKITSEINKKMKISRIETERVINPNQPVVTEVYYPDRNGVKPNGEFVLWGNNFQTTSGIATVTVVIGQNTLTCKPLPSKCSPERLQLIMPDFSGIIEPTNVLLTVDKDGVKSDPVNITILPELVTTQLDLSKFKNQLKTDSQNSVSTVQANNTSDGKHIYILEGNTILCVYHNCRLNNENAATEYTGIDEWFLTTELKNNWVIKKVIFYDNMNKCGTVSSGQTSANLSTQTSNTPTLNTRITWYNNQNMCFQSNYMVSYVIEGPKGTNYW